MGRFRLSNRMLARRVLGLNKRLVANRLANGFPSGMAYAGAVQEDAVALQDDPDYNLEYVDALFDPLPPRPLMMGINNTALAALREREQGNWGDLSADEQVKLYRSFFKNSFPEMLQPTDQWKGVLGAAPFLFLLVVFKPSNMLFAVTIMKNQTSVVSGTCTNPDGNKRERMKPHGTSSGKTKTSNPDKIAHTGTTPTIAGRTQTPFD